MQRILHALATDRFATLDGAATLEEWLLRPFRRRAAARALQQASASTSLTELSDLARVARLRAAGVALDAGMIDDARVVASAYGTLAVPPDRGAPVQSLGVVATLLLACVAFFGWRAATRPFDAESTRLGKSFGRNFGAHVADVANGARPTPDAAMARVFSFGAPKAPADVAMKALFGAQVKAAQDPSLMPDVFQKTRDANAAFSMLAEPWYLDARYYRDAPLLYAFYLEREDEGRAPGFANERVVFLWRLDHLNLSKAALGYTHRESDAAIVLYDQVEEFLIQDVLPALAEGEKVDLIDQASRDPKKAWQDDIETRAARMVRESFAGAADHAQLVELGALLAKRRAIVSKWSGDLAAQNRSLRVPNRLLPEADYVRDLWQLVPTSSRYEWEAVHDKLASRATLATFEALRDRFADDVARHELQHRFDAQRTKECAVGAPCAKMLIPAAVKNRVGDGGPTGVMLGSMPARVHDEVSAYLAQMARPSGMPKMAILGLLRTVLDREAWGDVYCNATLVILDVLASELGFVDEGMPLVAGGAVQRASVASLVALLFAKSDDDLRRAAATKWRELQGYDLPNAETKQVRQNVRWRH